MGRGCLSLAPLHPVVTAHCGRRDSGATTHLGPAPEGAEAPPSRSGPSGTHGFLSNSLPASPANPTKMNETQRSEKQGSSPALEHVRAQ